ncbi:PREDICTED: protein croquemort-like [Rhagoletis zephyria]|uniref:protein croquemort-like n=1 Tax=Rhagoletis zephyria TaxID=28612 RepID=UPI000811446C|nr:PREDICTED: protein croquemort-like [Rhagoletis zephyria]XP_017492992.1 PREDICTED: protein croquemort-like [Rhagoletis zephyria]
MCCSCCGVIQQKVWLSLVAIAFLALGLVFVIWWPNYITDMIYNELPLSQCSRTYDKWSTIPIPIYMYMYLFNWTNPEQVRTSGVKPNFEQVGPFVFREEKIKEDVTWYTNKTVSFFGQRTWYFESEMSGASLDALITCPHLPSLAASYVVRDEPRIIKIAFNIALNNNGGALYQTHSAGEWLFDGFYDEFLDYAIKLNNSMTGAVESNEFAWFLNRNGSKEFEGLFTIHTGQGDLRQMGEIKFWKGSNHTGYYEGECGRVNGSTADLFVPNRGAEEYITIYITDTCRIMNLVPSSEVVIEGIKAIKYETKPDTFDNGQLNPDMKCYCPAEMQPDNCPATGATYLGPCADGVPMYLSHPHFMYADESYASTITGLSPDYEKHNFFIVMEPKLGVPLEVNANVMVSLHIRNDSDITILRDITDFYAPLFVTSSKAVIDKKLAREVKLALSLPDIGFYMGITFISIGSILAIIGIYLTVTRRWYGERKLSKD